MSSTRENPCACASCSQRSSRREPIPRRALCRIDEEGADLGRLGSWIEARRIAAAARIAAEQGRSVAPAAATEQSSVFFGQEIGLIGQELGIDAESAAQGAFDLCGPVVRGAQAARGTGDQRFDLRDVVERGLAQKDCHVYFSGRAAERSMANAV